MTPIYFFDPGAAGYQETRRNWQALADPVWTPSPAELVNQEASNLAICREPLRELEKTGAFVCIVHFSRLDGKHGTLAHWCAEYPNARFIAISGSPIENVQSNLGNLLYYRFGVGQALDSDPFTIQFRRWYLAWNEDEQLSWDLLDGVKPHLLALRLLCDAWILAGGGATKQIADGIVIHAPIDLNGWLLPFGKDATAESVSKQMGRFEPEARALFDALGSPLNAELVKSRAELFVNAYERNCMQR